MDSAFIEIWNLKQTTAWHSLTHATPSLLVSPCHQVLHVLAVAGIPFHSLHFSLFFKVSTSKPVRPFTRTFSSWSDEVFTCSSKAHRTLAENFVTVIRDCTTCISLCAIYIYPTIPKSIFIIAFVVKPISRLTLMVFINHALSRYFFPLSSGGFVQPQQGHQRQMLTHDAHTQTTSNAQQMQVRHFDTRCRIARSLHQS